MSVDNKELDRMLQQAFDHRPRSTRSAASSVASGSASVRPSSVSDLANAWTRPGNPFTCDQDAMDNAIMPACSAC